MRNKLLFLLLLTIAFISCNDNKAGARQIMNKAMKAHGADVAAKGELSFNFRGIDYTVTRDGGTYNYERHLMIANDTILDKLDNNGFYRYNNGIKQPVADSISTLYTASLNSVIYFAQLPYSLDGDAINLEYLDLDTINDKTYHQIKVTFNEEGGGEDYEDVFVYWINAQDFLIDYLAYSYCEEECGYRFRESVNRRNLNGVIVQDYNNYKAQKIDPVLSHMDDLFENDELQLLSKIELERASFIGK